METEKKYVSIANGERLAYVEKGEGVPVILIHGNVSSSLFFLPFFRRLPQGFRAIAPDIRGLGDSSYCKRFDSLKELGEDIKMFADALGIKKAHLVGWSTGGGIALEIAALYPDFALSVFSIEGTSHKGYPIFQKDALGNQTSKPYPNKEAMASDPIQVAPTIQALEQQNKAYFKYIFDVSVYTGAKPDKDDEEIFLTETLKQRCLADIDWALAVQNMSVDANAYREGDNTIGKIKCPCAFTSGDIDFVVPRAMVIDNVNAIEGAILFLYEKCGHYPFVDCPDKLTTDIINFIK